MRKRTLAMVFPPAVTALVLSLVGPPALGQQLRDMRSENVAAIAVASEGSVVATGERTSRLRIWDASSRSVVHTLRGHSAQISALAFSPDGATLASGSYDPSIRIWDVRSGELRLNLRDHPGHVKSLAFSGDGRLLVSTGADGARIWDLPSGALRTMIPTTRGVVAAVFSPDGAQVATAGGNGVTIWDVATGRRIRNCDSSRNELILALAFSPDGRSLAGGGTGRTARLWDTRTGDVRAASDAGGDSIRGLAYDRDGSSLLIVDRTGSRRWEPRRRASETLAGRGSFSAVALSPDGRVVAASLGDESIEVWSTARSR
jgi:WD40 repeat protein